MNCGLCKQPIRGDERYVTDHYKCSADLHQSFRDDISELLRIAKEATNGWACYAKRQIEHDEIARLHAAIAEAEGK